MMQGYAALEDLVYVCVSDPVDINPWLFNLWARGFRIEECLKRMKEKAMENYDMRWLATQRQLHRLFLCVKKDIEDQFRVFTMLEPSLRKPAQRLFSSQPISEEMERTLVKYYFEINDKIMRGVIGLAQASKRKRIRDLATRLGESERYCTRQLDNVETILEHLVRRNTLRHLTRSARDLRVSSPTAQRGSEGGGGITTSATNNDQYARPSFVKMSSAEWGSLKEKGVIEDYAGKRLFENIIEEDFRMPSLQARKYSAIVFLCRYRMEMARGRLALLTLKDLIFIARTIMKYWSEPITSLRNDEKKRKKKDEKMEKKDIEDFQLATVTVSANDGKLRINGGSLSSKKTPADFEPERKEDIKSVKKQNEHSKEKISQKDEKETKTQGDVASDEKNESDVNMRHSQYWEGDIPVTGNALDKHFLSRLSVLKNSNLLRDRQALDEYVIAVRSRLSELRAPRPNFHARAPPPSSEQSPREGSPIEGVDDTKLTSGRCSGIVKGMLIIATKLGMERERKDLLPTIYNSIVIPILRYSIPRDEAKRFFNAMIYCFPVLRKSIPNSDLATDLKRYLLCVVEISNRLVVFATRQNTGTSRRMGLASFGWPLR